MEQIVDWIDRSLQNAANDSALEQIKHEVHAFMQQFPLFSW
jgi:glycine hydroxymethyltransferase